MTTSATSPASVVARLNDDFRRHPGKGWMITAGVRANREALAKCEAAAQISGQAQRCVLTVPPDGG